VLHAPPYRFKVLLSISNIPAHAWSVEFMQAVVDSSSLVFGVAPSSLHQSDLSSFMVVVWARHLDLVPLKVCYLEPEPVEPFIEAPPPPAPSSLGRQRSYTLAATFFTSGLSFASWKFMTSTLQVTLVTMVGLPLMKSPTMMTIRAMTWAGGSSSHGQKSPGLLPIAPQQARLGRPSQPTMVASHPQHLQP
jgi:hypothetical protein